MFCPAEADTCIRTATCSPGTGSNGCWVWCPNSTDSIKSETELQKDYLTTVGHNSNFLLNVSPNTSGLIEPVDMRAYSALGGWVQRTFKDPKSVLAAVYNQVLHREIFHDAHLDLKLPSEAPLHFISIMEDQTEGQRIWGWKVQGRVAAGSLLHEWKTLFTGESIGHKRLLDCRALSESFEALRFIVTLTGTDRPAALRMFSAHGSAAVSAPSVN